MKHIISDVFPCPVYIAKRNSNLDSTEEKEIEDFVTINAHLGPYTTGALAQVSDNTEIFDTKLKNLKEFIEQHIKIYVKEIFNPKKELDFYITQSWLNVVEPGGNIATHYHANSIISGTFYVSTEEDDRITFSDPNAKVKELINFEQKGFTPWNANTWFFPANNNELILFPSWIEHEVAPNENATTDRISISFNTFVRGTLGMQDDLNELILK
jgi:uncharacterized protein (TIGR02466 family)